MSYEKRYDNHLPITKGQPREWHYPFMPIVPVLVLILALFAFGASGYWGELISLFLMLPLQLLLVLGPQVMIMVLIIRRARRKLLAWVLAVAVALMLTFCGQVLFHAFDVVGLVIWQALTLIAALLLMTARR